MNYVYRFVFSNGKGGTCPSKVRIPDYLVFFQKKLFSVEVISVTEYCEGQEVGFKQIRPKTKTKMDRHMDDLQQLYNPKKRKERGNTNH